MGFVSELRRRKVFRVGIAYAVVAWLLLQAVDIVVPILELPDWVSKFILLLLVIGLPLALFFAWAYEITPEGVKLDKDVDRGSSTHHTGRRFDFIIIALIVVAVLYFIADRIFVDRKTAEQTDVSDIVSIAVLPFVNMSGNPDNEYFSDGISEEVLNGLARLPELRVAARTSSFSFKNQEIEVPEIARELDVQMVLEGSVRRQADRVRVTAQLIDASNGFQLWSETYDRDLKDVFAVQEEIAGAVAGALELQLAGPKRSERAPRLTDPNAYDKYLRGRALVNTRNESELWQAATLFEEVIAAEPQFAEAYAGLGSGFVVLPFHSTAPRTEVHARARDAAELALALDPGLAEAYAVLGDVAIHALRFDAAEVFLQRAVTVSPSLASGHFWLGEKHLFVGDFDEAERELKEALKLDPLSRPGGYLFSLILLAQGRPAEARAVCERVLEIGPDFEMCRAVVLRAALGSQDPAAIRTALTESARHRGGDAEQVASQIADALVGEGDKRALARQLMATPYHAVFDPEHPAIVHDSVLPALLLALGEPELAMERLVLNASNEPNDALMTIWDPQLDELRCRASFQQLVSRLNLVDRRAGEICAMGAVDR